MLGIDLPAMDDVPKRVSVKRMRNAFFEHFASVTNFASISGDSNTIIEYPVYYPSLLYSVQSSSIVAIKIVVQVCKFYIILRDSSPCSTDIRQI